MDSGSLFDRAAALIRRARHLVVLTGAGISTPSGIPDFRSAATGLWRRANPLLVASMPVFRLRPQFFYEWVRPLARLLLDAEPNPAHLALARLEQGGRVKAIVTQNIDALHQKAGSEHVIEVHGHIREATCVRCRRVVSTDAILPRYLDDQQVPRCECCGGVLKPNVVLLGEPLPAQALDAARTQARRCDLMLIAGSSLTVVPAADLPFVARERGADVIVVNRDPTPIDEQATLVIREDVSVALPRIAALALGETGA
jgi:NAD-dependent deacetylase